jgi:DNA-directed RNA polymerase sigma subunit (sigma70/sigma32)
MPRPQSPIRVMLTKEEQSVLEQVAGSWVLPHRAVVRARVILRLAEQATITSIAAEFEVQRKMVRKWGGRFVRKRLRGLEDEQRSGRPARFSP